MKAALKILVLIWLIYFVDLLLPVNLVEFGGICPRQTSHLLGIFTYFLIHINLDHLIANSLAIFVLTWALMTFYPKIGTQVWLLIAVLSGAAVWLFARPNTCHAGISGVIFGLIGFFIASGIFRFSLKSILVAIAVALTYGGAIFTILKPDPNVSWEGHLFGFFTGVFIAWLYRNVKDKTSDAKKQKELTS